MAPARPANICHELSCFVMTLMPRLKTVTFDDSRWHLVTSPGGGPRGATRAVARSAGRSQQQGPARSAETCHQLPKHVVARHQFEVAPQSDDDSGQLMTSSGRRPQGPQEALHDLQDVSATWPLPKLPEGVSNKAPARCTRCHELQSIAMSLQQSEVVPQI